MDILSPLFLIALGPLGGPELLIIAALILILFGAKKIPTFARSLGKSMGEFKKAKREFEEEMKVEMEEAESPKKVEEERVSEKVS
jgi:sec-independent protein translocase protein TatA